MILISKATSPFMFPLICSLIVGNPDPQSIEMAFPVCVCNLLRGRAMDSPRGALPWGDSAGWQRDTDSPVSCFPLGPSCSCTAAAKSF